jgi:hypothetical protein
MIRFIVAVVSSRNIDLVIFSPSSGDVEKKTDPATAHHTHTAKDMLSAAPTAWHRLQN